MRPQTHIVFLLNLLQDVNVLRPLAYLAAREFDASILLLVSSRFIERDLQRSWQREIAEIGAGVNGAIHIYQSPLDAYAILQGKRGMIFAGSESSLSAHAETHNVFRIAPAGFLKVTLQHGLECVGFLQNREHDIAHGRDVAFAADVLCGWSSADMLTSLLPSQRPKLYVTGPSAILQIAPQEGSSDRRRRGGLVCENLHSVRLSASGSFGVPFMDTFREFCDRLGERGSKVSLRPHPGGQYVLKNNVALPENVVIANEPIYKLDLGAYDFGISAPSSVLIDLVLAGVPAAMWRDRDGVMDASRYKGLAEISGVEDWIAFVDEATGQPEIALARQEAYLDGLAVLTDRSEIYRRFASLMANASAGVAAPSVTTRPVSVPAPRRVLFVANGVIPTLQLSFLKPLQPLVDAGEMETLIVTEADLVAKKKAKATGPSGEAWMTSQIDAFNPDLIVCCRYSGPHAGSILKKAAELGVPVIFHIDDDLLNIPREIGEKKWIAHNMPERLATVRALLDGADLVYCSTERLRKRFRDLGFDRHMVSGDIYCSGVVLSPAALRPVRKIGYMGFDHAHDLELILPAIVRLLRRNTELTFELFGSIPRPAELEEFGDRVTTAPPVRVYSEFLQRFAELEWDIGICPLAGTPFNAVKANTKWVEYTSVGAAVVGSRGTVYDECCSDGCGVLCVGETEWLDALERLMDEPEERHQQVVRAQRRLEEEFSVERLRNQVLSIFAEAEERRRARIDDAWTHAPAGALGARARPLAEICLSSEG